MTGWNMRPATILGAKQQRVLRGAPTIPSDCEGSPCDATLAIDVNSDAVYPRENVSREIGTPRNQTANAEN